MQKKVTFVENAADFDQMCSGCRLCELVCSFAHHNLVNPRLARIQVVSLEKGVKVPVVCQQCADAPCAAACPTGALFREKPEGPVLVNEGRCIGCGTCVNVCPVGGISLSPVTGTAIKCDLCQGDPQCVRFCPTNVLKLLTAHQLSHLKKKDYAAKLREVEGGGCCS